MSGGFFNYTQHHINEVVDAIERVIAKNVTGERSHILDEQGEWHYSFGDKTLSEFKNGINALKKAFVYAHRIDWLLSGDDGEETFHKRLKEELEGL